MVNPMELADRSEMLIQYSNEEFDPDAGLVRNTFLEIEQKKKSLKRKILKDKLRKHLNYEGPHEKNPDIIELKHKDGVVLFRKDSFKRLLNNDSLKYHENGMQEVFDEFQKYSIKS